MRVLLVSLWLLMPIGAMAFHFGPGQDLLKHDRAADWLRQADQQRIEGRPEEAKQALAKGLELLPESETTRRQRARLELCKVQLENQGLPEAHLELEGLLEDMQADPGTPAELVAECRETLANAQYYITWLMRLEGLGEEEWGPEIESAQQHLRWLALSAEKAGDETAASRLREDLEAAVRLARMDLGELQAAKLPCQCNGCCNSKKKSTRKSKPKTSEDARGATSGPPVDGSGS